MCYLCTCLSIRLFWSFSSFESCNFLRSLSTFHVFVLLEDKKIKSQSSIFAAVNAVKPIYALIKTIKPAQVFSATVSRRLMRRFFWDRYFPEGTLCNECFPVAPSTILSVLHMERRRGASALYITELDKRSLHPHLSFSLHSFSHPRSLLTHPQWRQGLMKSQLPSPLLSVHGPTVHMHECPHQSDGMVLVFSPGTGEPGRVFSSLSHLRPAPHHTASLPMINRLSQSLYTPTRP